MFLSHIGVSLKLINMSLVEDLKGGWADPGDTDFSSVWMLS